MARRKGLGIFGSVLGVAFKVGGAVAKEIAKPSKVDINRKLKERQAQMAAEKKLNQLNETLDAFAAEQDREFKELKAKNKAWSKDFNKLGTMRSNAKEYEKQGKLKLAINWHLKALDFGETSERLHYGNYAANIGRIIILYGKVKDKESLENFLIRVIYNYPEAREIDDWKKRLSKLNNK